MKNLFLLLFVALPVAARAQRDSSAAVAYRSAALRVAPVWNGLAVVRGETDVPVATLGFFWPHDVTDSIRGDILAPGADSVASYARHALALRQPAAFLTDLGAATLGVAVLHALIHGGGSGSDAAIGAVGMTFLAVSLPLHFAADDALSKAVWWYNARLTR